MFEFKISPVERKFAGLSLRDAHKQRTADLLRQTALRMFLADGYETTTAEAIAENAGASVRTFFRYFATKDEVVFKGQGDWAKLFIESFMGQPATLSRLDAICEALIEAAEGMDRKSVKAYGKIVDNSHMLRGRAAELLANSISEVASAIARKEGRDEPDAAISLFTQIVFVTYRAAVDDWRDGKFSGQLEGAIREKFELFSSLFADTAVPAASPVGIAQPAA
jgi:AcrR family transcriptional regulator